jgi:hypothetical protein
MEAVCSPLSNDVYMQTERLNHEHTANLAAEDT